MRRPLPWCILLAFAWAPVRRRLPLGWAPRWSSGRWYRALKIKEDSIRQAQGFRETIRHAEPDIDFPVPEQPPVLFRKPSSVGQVGDRMDAVLFEQFVQGHVLHFMGPCVHGQIFLDRYKILLT